MEDYVVDLLIILALATFGMVIAFAIWSKVRTEKKLNHDDSSKSSLARDTPDPNFQPDPAVTDPNSVIDRR